MIYHIADEPSWQRATETGIYEHPSMKREGFIHACNAKQLAGVRKRYYDGVKNLTVLHINESLVSSLIKYELSPSVNEIFPHIYGPLNADAVLKAEVI